MSKQLKLSDLSAEDRKRLAQQALAEEKAKEVSLSSLSLSFLDICTIQFFRSLLILLVVAAAFAFRTHSVFVERCAVRWSHNLVVDDDA